MKTFPMIALAFMLISLPATSFANDSACIPDGTDPRCDPALIFPMQDEQGMEELEAKDKLLEDIEQQRVVDEQIAELEREMDEAYPLSPTIESAEPTVLPSPSVSELSATPKSDGISKGQRETSRADSPGLPHTGN